MKKLLVILILVLAFVGLLTAVYHSDWLDEFNEARNSEFAQKREAGLLFGQSNHQNQCFTEALEGLRLCNGYACGVSNGKFLRGCLESAQTSDDFCQDVPEYQEEITEDEKTWAKYLCWDLGIAGEGCRLLHRQKQYFCQTP